MRIVVDRIANCSFLFLYSFKRFTSMRYKNRFEGHCKSLLFELKVVLKFFYSNLIS